jgi:hypothetical protein
MRVLDFALHALPWTHIRIRAIWDDLKEVSRDTSLRWSGLELHTTLLLGLYYRPFVRWLKFSSISALLLTIEHHPRSHLPPGHSFESWVPIETRA